METPSAHAVHKKETYTNIQGCWKNNVMKTTNVTYVLTWRLWQCWLGCKKVIWNFVVFYVNRTGITMSINGHFEEKWS